MTIVDVAGNTNSTETRKINLDMNPPTIHFTNKTNIEAGENVTLIVNASDAVGGLSVGIASVLSPNGSITNYTMTLNGNLFNLTIRNLTLLGDYDVNYTVNDSLGFTAKAKDMFEFYNPINDS